MLVVNNLPVNARDARDTDLIPGLGRSPGVGKGNPLQYCCLKNTIDQSLEGYSSWGRKESDTTERLSTTQQSATCEALSDVISWLN